MTSLSNSLYKHVSAHGCQEIYELGDRSCIVPDARIRCLCQHCSMVKFGGVQCLQADPRHLRIGQQRMV